MTSIPRSWIAVGVVVVSAGFVITILTPPTPPDAHISTVQLTSGETDLISDPVGFGPGPEIPSPDIAISIDGVTLFQDGNATATSGMGDVALAFGDDAHATATGGLFDTAFADGTNTTATADFGNFDDAAIFNPESAASLISGGDAVAQYGSGDTAFVLGDNAATAGGLSDTALGNSDLAAVLSGELANATATGAASLWTYFPILFLTWPPCSGEQFATPSDRSLATARDRHL